MPVTLTLINDSLNFINQIFEQKFRKLCGYSHSLDLIFRLNVHYVLEEKCRVLYWA